jgi:hypothetical protein
MKAHIHGLVKEKQYLGDNLCYMWKAPQISTCDHKICALHTDTLVKTFGRVQRLASPQNRKNAKVLPRVYR